MVRQPRSKRSRLTKGPSTDSRNKAIVSNSFITNYPAGIIMNQAELLAHLTALTGNLNPDDTDAEDLHLLRRGLAVSLRDLPGEARPPRPRPRLWSSSRLFAA